MNGIVGLVFFGVMYVRVFYDYEVDDRMSLSFYEGDIIQVIIWFESGWWDGVINGVRGWFFSNYCQIIDEFLEFEENGELEQVEEEFDDYLEVYEGEYEDEDGFEVDDVEGFFFEGIEGDRLRVDFWIF